MKKKITEEFVRTQLEFGLQVALAMDMLAKNENDGKIVQSAISVLLMALGYSQEDSYGAAITIHMAEGDNIINDLDITIALPAIVCTAAGIIDKKQIPGFIRDQVKETLAHQ